MKKPSGSAKSERQPPERLLYPKNEAGFLLGISARSIDYLISAGRLKTVRIGKRNLIPVDELRRFARADPPEAIRSNTHVRDEESISLVC
jgi:excisionase family DNA binding protein